MTAEALSLVICLASGVFGRPAWTPEKCAERAGQLMEIGRRHGIDPLLMVAVNIQECDMREDVNALVTAGEGKHKKVIGIDACPMGVRIIGSDWKKHRAPEELYELAARRMEHWKSWCERGHHGRKPAGLSLEKHHFIAHYNQGNPVYASQVLGFLATITHRKVREKDSSAYTERTREIVRRLTRAFSRWWVT